MSDAARNARTQALLHAPLLPTLLRLAAPNIIGLFATTLVIGYDGFILGRLGADALAGVALVFPLLMLMQQMSAGAMGGAVTAAVARALGGGQVEQASRLAQQAVLIACAGAAVFAGVMGLGGTVIYRGMGGRDAALQQALAYSAVVFGGAIAVWLTNILAAVVRGSGNMVLPAALLSGAAGLHMLLCPLLVFGWGPVPGLGVPGAGWSSVATSGLVSLVFLNYLARGRGAVRLGRSGWKPNLPALQAILRVGAPALLSPLLSNGAIAAATAFIGSYGTAALAGFGVASRLEYIMVPISFGFGGALTAMVATNMGGGQPARALRAAWTGSLLVAAITGSIGIVTAIEPALWMNLFSRDPAVQELGTQYLHIVGAFYGLFGLGLSLYFASQGAGRMLWPIVGSVARFVLVAAGGWLAVHVLHWPIGGFFALVAAGFVVYAAIIGGSIWLGRWGVPAR